MALTEQQEKELLEGFGSLKKTVADLSPIAAKVPELEKTLAAKNAEIEALKTGHANLTQDKSLQELKSKYPDVPESTLKLIPEANRDAEAKVLQEKFSKVKAPQAETDPMKLWANAGGIGPTDEAEKAAQQQEATKRYNEFKNSGNVMGMLSLRGAEFVASVRKALAPAK
jgi:hypothetical protein